MTLKFNSLKPGKKKVTLRQFSPRERIPCETDWQGDACLFNTLLTALNLGPIFSTYSHNLHMLLLITCIQQPNLATP